MDVHRLHCRGQRIEMTKTNEHGRLIAAAAKAALLQLGCAQKGQSRVWYSDQRCWLIAVEFQPSGWPNGVYLNIFVTWLWAVTRGHSVHYRPFDLISFVDVDQFAPQIANMAQTAANEVGKVRQQFKSLRNIHDYIIEHAHRDGWPIYDAAVSSGLIGDLTSARSFFERMAAWATPGYDWQEQLKRDSATLAAIVDQPVLFRAKIVDLIAQRRHLMRLPPDPDCLDALNAQVELSFRRRSRQQHLQARPRSASNGKN